ncbi:methyltransferase [Novosphingobium fuchskuhlense]|uniref:Methyltransferase n=1 Tax=Novosphingobium fuchskuhlense TaxID=1117702 RepID=A0A117UVQ9_9SPHN|nr:methyltransferase domain-containing protein [Novosphingobium fuchskuhlense]KUR71736.1 methyltransferase [Novosphingobium fuchskuhlense]
MTGAQEWQGRVGQNWAAEWERTDRSFATLTPLLLDAIAAEPGTRVVDIGCGAGELSIAVAMARPDARVTGVDISQDLLGAARVRAGDITNLAFTAADASEWVADGASPDLYVSRHGVMFFTDPPAAFAHLSAVAAPGARLVFTCFRAASENNWAAEIAHLLPPSRPAPAAEFPPGPFAFADPDHVRRCLKGWRDVSFRPLDFAYVAGSGSNPVADALSFFSRIGPAAAAIRTLPDQARAAFERGLLELVQSRSVGGRVCFPAAAWLVTATADNG